jgi:hypothetical protein
MTPWHVSWRRQQVAPAPGWMPEEGRPLATLCRSILLWICAFGRLLNNPLA